MKLRGQTIYFRSNWSGDKAWERNYFRRKYNYFTDSKCPYCLAHREVMNRPNSEVIFKKFSSYPIRGYGFNKVYRLYWRTHRNEWERMDQIFKGKRK